MPNPKSNFELTFDAFRLWIGDPKTRVAKLLIVSGLPMVASPWWQPVINGFVVKYLGVAPQVLEDSVTWLVVSGWLLVVLGVLLYIRATKQPYGPLPRVVDQFTSDLTLDSSVAPAVQRNAVTAFNQLCVAAIDVPRVHLEGIIAEKRAETNARVRRIAGTTDNLNSDMSVPADYAAQAVKKFSERIILEQLNLDQVCSSAAQSINQESATRDKPLDADVPPIDPNWLNHFEKEARNANTDEIRVLFGRILAGEIQRPTSFSIRSVKLLRELDSRTASLFRSLCSCCISLRLDEHAIFDARVPSLGGSASQNCLQVHGFDFGKLNLLHEYGLIISDYNSYLDYKMCIAANGSVRVPFFHQKSQWGLIPIGNREPNQGFRIHGIALSSVGKELLPIVDIGPAPSYTDALIQFFPRENFQMALVSA